MVLFVLIGILFVAGIAYQINTNMQTRTPGEMKIFGIIAVIAVLMLIVGAST